MPATLDPQVLSAIADLELVARVTVDGTIAGLHRSPFHGYSAEFSQYRPYRAGDDLKYVDWKLFARTDRFYTKQFRETTNLVAHARRRRQRVDGLRRRQRRRRSSPTRACSPRRWRTCCSARATASAWSSTTTRCGSSSPAAAAGLTCAACWSRSRSCRPSGRTAAAAPLKRAAELLKRRGLICVFSDLYDDEAALERELRRAVGMGHEVAVFHVLTRDELELRLPDEAEVEDLESGATLITRPADGAAVVSSADRGVPRHLAHPLRQLRHRLHAAR